MLSSSLFDKQFGKDKEENALATALASTLSNKDNTAITPYTPVQTGAGQSQQSSLSGILGGAPMLSGGGTPMLSGGVSTNAEQDGNGKMLNDIAGLGQQGYGLYNAIGNGAGGAGWVGIGLNALNGIQKGFNDEDKILGGFGNGLQGFFGVDDENDSEIMQGLKGAGTGAMMGATVGSIVPGIGTAIGAIIGGALGLGSSFLDDM